MLFRSTLPGFSTGQAIAAMEQLAATNLPSGFSFEWTEIALQEIACQPRLRFWYSMLPSTMAPDVL